VEGTIPVVAEGVAPVVPPRDQGFACTEAGRHTAVCWPLALFPTAFGGPLARVESTPQCTSAFLLHASPTRPSLLQVVPTIFDPNIRIQSKHMKKSMNDG
jgi:hypothetical protein